MHPKGHSEHYSFLSLSSEASNLKSNIKKKGSQKTKPLEAAAYPYGKRPTERESSEDLSEMWKREKEQKKKGHHQ